MIKSYFGLLIFFAVQHQVFSLSANVDHRKHMQKIRKDRKNMLKELQNIQKRSAMTQDPIDNYDLIVTEPSETFIKPVLRHRQIHHRHRLGKGAIKNYKPQMMQSVNTLRKNNNITVETNMTRLQDDKNDTTTNYLNENWRGGEKSTTQIQKEQDAISKNYVTLNRGGEEKEATKSQNPVTKNQNVTHVVPFYRRVNYLNDQERNKPQKWVHCLDLVGPRLKGYKGNWRPKQLSNRHIDIKRLTELLNTNVAQFTEEEIVSLLSQISNIDLRLFQWDYSAVTRILNIIISGPSHSFRTLKAGVKHMFDRWHLDTSAMRTFLEQTRIFRPPCIDISGTAGYTKKAGGIPLYTKPDKPTKKHRGGDESCHSRESSAVNNNND